MNYYIGVDIGTSGTKSVLFDNKGMVKASFTKEYNIISVAPGYAEENPLDWLNATIETLKEISKVNIDGVIKGIGLSGQMHGLVLLDEFDKPLRNSIIWCDNRTSKEAKEIEEVIGREELIRITGNIPMAAFTLAKLLWVKNNEPDIFKKIKKAMLPKDYVRYMLTKEFLSEYSDASGMQMMDINKKEFSKELLANLGIPFDILPGLTESVSITGYLTKEMEELTGLTNVYLVGGAGDQAAGAIGNGIINETDASIVLGSSGVVFAPTANVLISKEGKYQTFCHAVPNKFHIMGVTNGAGNSFKWYRDNLCELEQKLAKNDLIDVYSYLTKDAENINPGSDGLLYLPYLLGERTPHLDPYATGVFFGIRNTTTKAHFTRAILEGVSYSLLDCFKLIPNKMENVYISGGGARSCLWRTIIASTLNTPLKRIESLEGPALGVAILAMVANKEYESIDLACKAIIRTKDETQPNGLWYNIYQRNYEKYKKLYLNNKELFKEMVED